MIRLRAGLLLGLLASVVGATSAGAATLNLTQLPGTAYPQRMWLLSSSTPLSASGSQLRITENGQPVNGASVKASGTVGTSQFGTVLMIDTSQSMRASGVAAAFAAARGFVASRSPSQPVGLITFDRAPVIRSQLTTNAASLDKALTNTPALHGGTRLYDAASTALSMLKSAGISSGVIILLSDGRDTGSAVTESQVAASAAAQGVRVYSVGFEDASFDGSALQSIAGETHGSYLLSTSNALLATFKTLGAELANEYQISYTTKIPRGQPAQLSVGVPGAGIATASYTAPALTGPGAPSVVAPGTPFLQSQAAAILMAIVFAVLIGIAVVALTARGEAVGSRVSDFINPSFGPLDDHRTLVERALGDRGSRSRPRSPLWTRLTEDMDVAGINLTPEQLALATIVGTVLLGWLLYSATSSAAAPLLALMVPAAVNVVIKNLADRQRRMFDEQLPDNLQVIASAMRAGQTFVGALSIVVEDAPEPSRRELRRAVTDEQLGISLADALGHVTARMRSEDFQHVTVVATLQRETGGNTAEVIDLVTETIRDRIDLRRLVRSLTAQGRLSGLLLSFLPVGLLVMISLINPSYVHPLFHDTAGLIALGCAAVMVLLGAFAINRIVNIKI